MLQGYMCFTLKQTTIYDIYILNITMHLLDNLENTGFKGLAKSFDIDKSFV